MQYSVLPSPKSSAPRAAPPSSPRFSRTIVPRRGRKPLVVELVQSIRPTGDKPVVPLQPIGKRSGAARKLLAHRIRVRRHPVERQLRHRERRSVPPVHVLLVSVCVKEVVAPPALR